MNTPHERPPDRDDRTRPDRTGRRSPSVGAITVVLVVALVLLGTVGAGTGAVVGQPAPPAAYYGEVTVNGEPAPAGTEITAQIDGEARGSIEVTTAGEYGGSDTFDEKLEVEGESGDEVTFVVRGVEAETDPGTVTWESGDVRQVDLTFEGVPEDDSGDGGDGSGSDGGDGGGGGSGGATDDSGEDSAGGGGGGGGGGGAAAPSDGADSDSESASAAPDVAVVHEESTEIASGSGGPQAEFSDDATVERISFEGGSVSGSVSVQEFDGEPEDAGNSPGEPVAVSDISVPEEAAEQPASVRMGVSTERLTSIGADAAELRISRFSDGEWQQLETDVVEETDNEVILEAETPGFSYFSVNAVSDPNAAISIDPTSPSAGTEITLDASGSENEHGTITSYEWSVDGESPDGETTTVSIPEPGEYTVELTVQNDAGETDTTTQSVTVGSESGSSGSGTATADGSDGTSSEPAEEPAELPGFGPVVALVALIAAALLATRRTDEN